jgi:hypothetical protein
MKPHGRTTSTELCIQSDLLGAAIVACGGRQSVSRVGLGGTSWPGTGSRIIYPFS